MELIKIILIVYGISAIVTQSKIFEPLRDIAEKKSPDFWTYLTSCMQCFPFWAGIFVVFVLEVPISIECKIFPEFVNVFLTYLFSGAMLSGTTFFIHNLVIALMGERWDKKQEKERRRKIIKGVIKSGQ